MERMKMSRSDRAKQFAPFDALKGLHDALKIKEYEHDRIVKGELQEEQIREISKKLLSLRPRSLVKLTFFEDGHDKEMCGSAKLIIDENVLKVERKKVKLDDILDLEIIG